MSSEYERSTELKGAKGPINALAFSKDGKFLVSGGDDGSVRVYNTDTFVCEQILHSPKWGQVTALNWLTVEPPVDEKATSVCVGTGRGRVTLCPMSKSTTWFVWKEAQTEEAFQYNDAVESQAYDSLQRRLAVASHHGTIKVYSVEQSVTLALLWSRTVDHGIPLGLQFFGDANQFLLSHVLETGHMIARDAQTAHIQWEKPLAGGIGYAMLSHDERALLVDNLTSGTFDVYQFPASTPSHSLPFSSTRHIIKQCSFAQAGKIAVCGSDNGKIYVADMATGECIQTIPAATASEAVQTIATTTVGDGRHLIAGGTTSVAGKVCIWEKRLPIVKAPITVRPRTEHKSSRQNVINLIFVVLILAASYPNWAAFLRKSSSLTETPSAYATDGRGVETSAPHTDNMVHQEREHTLVENSVPTEMKAPNTGVVPRERAVGNIRVAITLSNDDYLRSRIMALEADNQRLQEENKSLGADLDETLQNLLEEQERSKIPVEINVHHSRSDPVRVAVLSTHPVRITYEENCRSLLSGCLLQRERHEAQIIAAAQRDRDQEDMSSRPGMTGAPVQLFS
ncbi:WD40-repeat-containing domain protein [Lyophyllum atratum]|nr:WD40-repeat-containing domain protein [Lyophyllum atratum]